MEDNGFEGIGESVNTAIAGERPRMVPKFGFVPTLCLLFLTAEAFRIHWTLGVIFMMVSIAYSLYPYYVVYMIKNENVEVVDI